LIFSFSRIGFFAAISLLLLPCSGFSQTYQVGGDSSPKPAAKAAPGQSSGQAAAEPQLGWGSNIQNARLARAAELALQRGDHALAFDYAQRAAQAAPNDPQLWFLFGYAARLAGKPLQSAEAYQKGLRLNPSSVDGMSGLAQTYNQMGRRDEAERILKQVVAADPRRRNDMLVLGDIYVHGGDYASAIEWLSRAERIEPAAQSELLIAISYEHLKQMDQANRYLEMARSRAPGNPDVDRSLAAFYRDTGDFAKAAEELKAIKNPKPDVVAELAYTYSLGGRTEEAARLYMQAANALPRDLGLQLSAAQAQVAAGSIKAADVFLERAERLSPDNYRLHAIRGQIAQMQDQESEAAREYSLALKNLPPSPPEGVLYPVEVHMNLQALYRDLDQPDLSQQQLKMAQTEIAAIDERGPGRAAFLRLRASIKMNAGQVEDALADMTESLSLNPRDPNGLQLDGDLLMRLGRTSDAIAVFKKALAIDAHSRFALTSLGYASRAAGDDREAEKYFDLLAHDYPSSYVAFLALGDLYSSRGDYKQAEAEYGRAYALAPQNPLIVSGGMMAAIEAHDLPLAGVWVHRVSDKMAMFPQVLREKERYYTFTGDNQQSADIGREAIKVLPRDREVVVYLGYDLLHLQQFAELGALTAQYKDVFPKDADIPLLAGHVYKHDGQLEEALQAFTEAIERDPNMVTAHTNRGFVLNDLHRPRLAKADFEQSLKREPRNAEAHMGLAFAELNLRQFKAAIRQTQLAEDIAGDSELVHTIRATAYGQEGLLIKAAAEYRAALKFDPRDGSLYLGLANVYFAQRRFQSAILQLQKAEELLPENASIYALLARANANLNDREETLRDVRLAERYAERPPVATPLAVSQPDAISDVYVSTGEALSTLGDQEGAMQRFSKALLVEGGDRVHVRLAIARLMAQGGHGADAERQIALAQMEAAVGDTIPPTGEQDFEAASIFQQMHEYELSETYLERARAGGVPDAAVGVALANSYLAMGETKRAAAQLADIHQTDDGEVGYQYLLAQAGVYQQENRGLAALSTFAQAASNGGEDQTAQQALLQAGGNEGFRIVREISALSNLIVQPIFEDSTVYVLDSKLNSPNGPVPITDLAALPPPRSSIETIWTNAFHLHLNRLPANGGFLQVRNSRGLISVPATSSIVHRNTTDYALNFGLDPTLRLGRNLVTFNSGVQGTIRRDTRSPIQLNENLFRVFTYASTSSFLNALSADGFASAEVGSFTDSPISGRAYSGAINFRVGSPWGRTGLVTGWSANDQRFTSQQLGDSQDYYTASYIGLMHRFRTHLNVEGIMEDRRSWRVVPFSPIHSAISQAIYPAGTVDFSPSPHWDVQATTSYESTRGFHVYDNIQDGFTFSYVRPLSRTFNDVDGAVHLRYPIRISGGVRQETFFNFTKGSANQFRPFFSITVF
jgi:tetratricopeptide (TPR) repeat protein